MTQLDGGFTFDLSKLELSDGNTKRSSVTAKATSSKYQEKRRNEALLNQQQARADRTHQARQLALQRIDSRVTCNYPCQPYAIF